MAVAFSFQAFYLLVRGRNAEQATGLSVRRGSGFKGDLVFWVLFFLRELFSPLLFWDPALRPGSFGVAHLNGRVSPDLIRQQGRWPIGYSGQPEPMSGRQGRKYHDYLREGNLIFLRSF